MKTKSMLMVAGLALLNAACAPVKNGDVKAAPSGYYTVQAPGEVQRPDDQMECRKSYRTGSHMATYECQTQAERRDIAARNQKALGDLQRGGSRANNTSQTF